MGPSEGSGAEVWKLVEPFVATASTVALLNIALDSHISTLSRSVSIVYDTVFVILSV